jgi:hypothetical protein
MQLIVQKLFGLKDEDASKFTVLTEKIKTV